VTLGLCVLPKSLQWKNIFGAGILGGIGFTMSIFITLLAFDTESDIVNSKIAILIASFIAAITGFIILKLTLKPNK
jgi:NhaA family Na+:H+ antiporter